MNLIIFCVIVVLIIALLCWAISRISFIPQPFNEILMVLVVVLGVVAIANRAGVF